MGSITGKKPHAVCMPYPFQGHINPMTKLAKLLHHKGFHITFVNTEYNHKRLLKSRGPNSLDGLPDFRYETIPDGLPPTDSDRSQDTVSVNAYFSAHGAVPFRELVLKLNDHASKSDAPPVTCIVSDGSLAFPIVVSEDLGLPNAFLWTTSVCGFMCFTQYQALIDKGLVPFKDESYLTNGDLDTIVDWVPGVKNIRLKDFPSFIRTTDPNDFMLQVVLEDVRRAKRASAIMFNSFDALDQELLDNLSLTFPRVHAIGPLHMLLSKIPQNPASESIGSSLWKEDLECIQWLNSKEPNSVIYVNFGSITVMTNQQLVEFAYGLANSKQNFLWVIRADLVVGDSAILPPDFSEETKGRGLIAKWCPQEQVLNHSSIGGFLTHCGWNSTLESICCGVPMICWPVWAEQQTNCRFVCVEWGIGMEIDSNVRRDVVEKQVRELLVGEKGKEMKKRAMEWKKKAEEAFALSNMNLDKLVQEVLLPKH